MKPRHKQIIQRRAAQRAARPTQEEIARLAYQLYERDGKPDGKDLEHWFNAEAMMESQFGSGRDHTEHDFSRTTGDE